MKTVLPRARSRCFGILVALVDALGAKRSSARAIHVLRNTLIDLRVGPPLALTSLTRGGRASNSDYAVLDEIFADRIGQDEVLVDIGSGAGRVINHWLLNGHSGPIVGLELDPRLAAATSRRFRRFPNVKIVAGDAMAQLPPSGTTFYMFNPFEEDDVRRLNDAISELPRRPGRRITYFNCKHLAVFEADDRFADIEVVRIAHPRADGQRRATIRLAPSRP